MFNDTVKPKLNSGKSPLDPLLLWPIGPEVIKKTLFKGKFRWGGGARPRGARGAVPLYYSTTYSTYSINDEVKKSRHVIENKSLTKNIFFS